MPLAICRQCHHSFPILAPPLSVQASRLNPYKSEPFPIIQRSSPFDDMNPGPSPFISAYTVDPNPPLYGSGTSYPSYHTEMGSLYPRPSHNRMGNNVNANAHLSTSNIKFPLATVVDPDTELTEGGDLPFDRLVVVPIQGRLNFLKMLIKKRKFCVNDVIVVKV